MRNSLFFSEISSGLLIHEAALPSLLKLQHEGSAAFDPFSTFYESLSFYGFDEDGGADELIVPPSSRPGFVVVPVKGTMLKNTGYWSIGTDLIASAITDAANDEHIAAVVLDIDSPGGTVSSVPPLLSAIDKFRAAGKKVIVSCDMCCSAAYWTAATCDYIYMNNDISAYVGSIGVLTTFVNPRKFYESMGFEVTDIYAPESTDKNKSYRMAIEGDFSRIEAELSEIATYFINDVKRRRPSVKEAPGVFSGDTFTAGKARGLGMIDGVMPLDDLIDFIPTLINL